ncbi:MAG: pyridoxal phosphate-dependent aminotransferase [Treponema sp.]|jgi:aspartate aminotransferase|nr:pyridoxal phosphate-dependent aminotransferase [Treponema sp.]
MPIASAVQEALGSASLIRKMFEEGNQLKKQYGPDNVFDFSLGNPDIEPPPEFHRVFVKLAQEDAKGSHGYMPNGGYPEVRDALAAKAGKEHGVCLEGSHIIMSVGAAGGLNVVFKAILNPEDEVIVSSPYFMEYRGYIGNHQGRIVEVEALPDFNLDVSAIKERLSEKTAAVLINSPHNPTGRIYPAETIDALGSALKAHGDRCGRLPYLIADEPYREIAYNNIQVPPILSAYSESLVVTSYSKSLSLPGERIGYIAVSPGIQDKQEVLNALIYATRTLGFVNAPALMQRIVGELTFERVDIGIYARRRDCFKQVLDGAGIKYAEPEGAFYLFCQVPGGEDSAFVAHLKKHLILGVPGRGFGRPGWVRFAYCVDEHIIQGSAEAFKKAMETWKF